MYEYSINFIPTVHKYESRAKDQYEAWLQTVNGLLSERKKGLENDDLNSILMLPASTKSTYFFSEMEVYLQRLKSNPLLPVIEVDCANSNQDAVSFDLLYTELGKNSSSESPEPTAKVYLLHSNAAA